jgi:hypothetical protein
MLSNGRFANLESRSFLGSDLASSEALTVDGENAQWNTLGPIHLGITSRVRQSAVASFSDTGPKYVEPYEESLGWC